MKGSYIINARLERVFDYVSDLSKHGEWSADPLEITPIDGSEIAVGKTYNSSVEFRGKTVTGTQTVTQFDAPNKFAFHTSDSTSEHDHVYTFSARGGSTVVEREAIGKWSFGTWLLASTMGGVMIGKPAMKKAYAQLQQKLEE